MSNNLLSEVFKEIEVKNLANEGIKTYKVGIGFADIEGSVMTEAGISFTIRSASADICKIHLFMDGCKNEFAILQFPECCHIGDVFSIFVFGIEAQGLEYAYSFEGEGHDKNQLILDPYAKAVVGQKSWGYKRKSGKPFEYRARVVKSTFDWQGVGLLDIPVEDMMIYELHVRGFTKSSTSGVQAKGTYKGLREKIPYLKDLGINTVELMPVFEFDEMESSRTVNGIQLYNFWGYNTVCFFAPNTGYTYDIERHREGDEFKHTIRSLKKAGISVILDVVFNHTAEGNENGPVFSFKGIDNDVYYMMTKDGYYYNFSGCGNAMNCNHPSVQKFIIDCLRFWVMEFKIDGFRFDLASVLVRDGNGVPMEQPPIIKAIAHDSVLSKVKLIAEAWDAGGMYQVGSFPAFGRWSEWNGRYRDDVRKFLKGDDGMAYVASRRIVGSPDIYGINGRGHEASVNFLTCHDGFTLYDLYAYNGKHNMSNGWDNTDGDNNNHSWNCGEEGETGNIEVVNLRKRMVKNAFATLLMSRGPAMFFSGDEFCNTQWGNNNAYCQDNEVSWIDWSRLEEFGEIRDFVRHMIHFRMKHPIIRKNFGNAACGYPSVSIHNGRVWDDVGTPISKLLGIMYAGKKPDKNGMEGEEDDIVLYLINAYWDTLQMDLPIPPAGMKWKADICTYVKYEDGQDVGSTIDYYGENHIYIPQRTAVVLTAVSL